MKRELLLFVPGLSSTKPGNYTTALMKNLTNFAGEQNTGAKFVQADGESSTYLYTLAGASEPARLYEFREVVWADLPTQLSALHAVKKAIKGVSLLCFAAPLFIRPRVIWGNKFQIFAAFGSALVLLLWYISVIIVVPGVAVNYYGLGGTSVEGWIEAASGWLTAALAWLVPVWAGASTLMLVLPVTRFVDSASAMKQYLRDEDGVAEAARQRLVESLTEIRTQELEAKRTNAPPPYDRITVLAYSFGAVPAIETLNNFFRGGAVPTGTPIRLVTLGAPLPLAVATRNRVADAVDKLAVGPLLSKWHFLWSPSDWLSADPANIRLPREGDSQRFEPHRLNLAGHRWIAETHSAYFAEDFLAEILLDQAADGGQRSPSSSRADNSGRPSASIGDASLRPLRG
jgi:hypothetical protein